LHHLIEQCCHVFLFLPDPEFLFQIGDELLEGDEIRVQRCQERFQPLRVNPPPLATTSLGFQFSM
jgi:hypothetical protein